MLPPNYYATQKSDYSKYLIPFMMLVHVIVFSLCVTSKGFPSQSFVHLIMGTLASCLAVCTTLLFSKSNVPKFIALFIVGTVLGKLPFCLIIPHETFLVHIPLQGKQLAQVVCERFFFLNLGFLGFAAGAVFASRLFWSITDPRKRDTTMSLPEKSFVLILLLYLGIQSMRAFLLLGMQIGAPSVVTREIFIPKLAGFLNILGSRGLLLVTTGLLAWALSRRSYFALAIAILAGLTYVFVEMAGGWRSGMFYYAICGTWIFLAAEPSKLKSRLKPLAIAFAIAGVFLFMPVLDYRNQLRMGKSPTQALQAVLKSTQVDSRSAEDTFYKISRRINGLDLYVVASYGARDHALGFISLLNGAASSFFTFGLLGVPEGAVTTYGMTYWGSMSIALGDQWLWLMGGLLGMFIGGFPLLCRHWFYSPTMRTLFEANISIILLHLTMGNGAFILYTKEIVIVFAVAIIFKFLATQQGSLGYYAPKNAQYQG